LPLRRKTRLRVWVDKLPGGATSRRVAAAMRVLLASPVALVLAVIDTLGIQMAAAGSFLCVALALGFRIDPSEWTALYAFFSAGEIVKALPGPPQGLGTMEMAYAYFFKSWAAPAQILSAALGIRAVALLCSLPGAAFLLRSHGTVSVREHSTVAPSAA
jgi:uncharacterized membrane protein YbhN (UPF0104 family)